MLGELFRYSSKSRHELELFEAVDQELGVAQPLQLG
jgi:hypothetical protein